MKKIMLVAALATVTACSETAPDAEPAATEEVAAADPAAPAEVMAADGQSPVGSYKITLEDGSVMTEELKADGTYASMKDGKVVETGKWNQKTPEQYCYTKDEEGAVEECNVEGLDANGVWTSKDPEGNVVTVERVTA